MTSIFYIYARLLKKTSIISLYNIRTYYNSLHELKIPIKSSEMQGDRPIKSLTDYLGNPGKNFPFKSVDKLSKVQPERKRILYLTENAKTKLNELIVSGKMLRISVKTKGCAGNAYFLDYIERPEKFDEVIEDEGLKVVIDSKALLQIIGTTMDWIEDDIQARFIFNNPNVKSKCGCGESVAF